MGLIIRRTDAELGIERSPSRMEIKNEKARIDIRHKEASVNIHTEFPMIIIDQYEAFASAGLKGSADLAREAAQLGYRQAMEYIGKTAQNGDRLAAIQYGGNVIADIAKRDSRKIHEFGLGFIPATGPRFSVEGGNVSIEAGSSGEGIHNGVEGDFIPGNMSIDYVPSILNIYMKKYPSIAFSYQGASIDTYL